MAIARPEPPRLMLVTDSSLCPVERVVERLDELVRGGVDIVQLREKDRSGSDLLQLTRTVVERLRGSGVLTMVNGDPAVALEAGAGGVQLPEGTVSVTEARARAVRQGRGDDFLIGRSVHDLAGARAAQQEGANLLVLGTIFPSRTHPGAALGGPALVQEVSGAVDVPVLAIGGISPANVADVIRAGADGVAVISAILGAERWDFAADELRVVMDFAWAERQSLAPVCSEDAKR